MTLERTRKRPPAGAPPYEVANQFVRHFDVGLIPHLVDDMTQR
jgi:hypothetical protein